MNALPLVETKLYEIGEIAGQWGIWSLAYDESAMLAEVRRGPHIFAAIIDPDLSATVMTPDNARKKALETLTKVQTFFPFSAPPAGLNLAWRLDGVWHARCYPHKRLLGECPDDAFIAKGRKEQGNETIWVSGLIMPIGLLVPICRFCDT